MTSIKIVFQSSESLTVYSDDPNSFSESVLNVEPPEIKALEFASADPVPELAEVKLTLRSGAIVLCQIAKGDMPKAHYIDAIVDCATCNDITYAKLGKQEAELDARFTAVRGVINNLPDLAVRLHLHKEYMKRKQAYVSAIEALVDGVIRRPNE